MIRGVSISHHFGDRVIFIASAVVTRFLPSLSKFTAESLLRLIRKDYISNLGLSFIKILMFVSIAIGNKAFDRFHFSHDVARRNATGLTSGSNFETFIGILILLHFQCSMAISGRLLPGRFNVASS